MNIKNITFTFLGIIIACGGSGLNQQSDAQASEDGGQCTCQGQQGPQGPIGPQGQQGPMGMQGAAGMNGTNGVDGKDGAQGPQGPQGPAGMNGTNGTNGYPSSKTELYVVTATASIPVSSTASVSAACTGVKDILISGSCTAATGWWLNVTSSIPQNDTTTSTAADWYCSAANYGSSAGTLTATAICVSVP